MKLIGIIYKILNKLFVVKILEKLSILTITLDKHNFEYYRNHSIFRLFMGTFGGVSILWHNYYLNFRGRVFFCNFKKTLKNKNLDLDMICIDSKNNKILLYSLLESLLLENDSLKYSKKTYPQLINEKYAVIQKENSIKNLIINKSGGFFHFYLEVIPIIIKYLNKDYNIYFFIEDKPFYRSILSFYNINYSKNFDYPSKDVCDLKMPVCYPYSKDVFKFRKYNLDTFGTQSQTPCNIYISRRNERARRISNEDMLIKELIVLGFVIIDPGTIEYNKQINYFRNANLIVTAHGAALSNIIWCKQNVKIIELNGDVDVRWHFAKIAMLLGFNYKLMLGKTINDVYFEVNIPQIKKLIHALCE